MFVHTIKIGILLASIHMWAATELSLSHMVKYAQSLPEYPTDQTTLKRQHYKGWYDFARRIMHTLGLHKNKFLRAHDFQQLLHDVVQQRAIQYTGGRLIEKMVPKAGTTFVIWGQLNGAFHSLLRDLQELKKLGYMREDLSIVGETYFVFNGDVIGESPYNVETCTVILYLMKKNPERIIYIKGSNEDKDRWLHSPFNDQLTSHLDVTIKDRKAVSALLNSFFNSLPLALYLIAPNERENKIKQLVRISYASPDDVELQEREFPYFFDIYTEPIISLLRNVKKEDDMISRVASYIYAQDRKNEFAITQGLLLRPTDKQWTGWTITSSPTAEFRQQYQFFNDAFVLLHTTSDMSDWKLTLYYQDVRTMHGFKQDLSWYLLSGQRVYDVLQAKIVDLEHKLNALQEHNNAMLKKCLQEHTQQEEPEDVLHLIHNATLEKLSFFYNHVLFGDVLLPAYTIKA